MTVSRYKMEVGCGFPYHVHDQEQIVMVLDGEIIFVVYGRDHRLRREMLIVIPPEIPHEAKVTHPNGADVISFVAPARTGVDDYVFVAKDP